MDTVSRSTLPPKFWNDCNGNHYETVRGDYGDFSLHHAACTGAVPSAVPVTIHSKATLRRPPKHAAASRHRPSWQLQLLNEAPGALEGGRLVLHELYCIPVGNKPSGPRRRRERAALRRCSPLVNGWQPGGRRARLRGGPRARANTVPSAYGCLKEHTSSRGSTRKHNPTRCATDGMLDGLHMSCTNTPAIPQLGPRFWRPSGSLFHKAPRCSFVALDPGPILWRLQRPLF